MKLNLQSCNEGSVLVVFNDDERWKEYSYYFFEEGIKVDVVNLAETAMAKVRESDYDIIIIEDYLSDSPGYILATRQGLPIILHLIFLRCGLRQNANL